MKDSVPGAESGVPDISYGARGRPRATLGNLFFYVGYDPINGFELWKSDGTLDGTTLVKDIHSGTGGANLKDLFPFAGKLYFSAVDGTSGGDGGLWKTDGTEAGTTLVRPFAGEQPFYLTELGGLLYFAANADSVNIGGTGLWKSDGTTAGTVVVKPNLSMSDGGSTPIQVVNGQLVFGTGSPWVSDGTTAGTRPLTLSAGVGSSTKFVGLDGLLFFGARDSQGTELWKSDGTTAGTALLKAIGPGVFDGLSADTLTCANGALYFSAADRAGACPTDFRADWELWSSDGTAAGTLRVQDIKPGECGSTPAPVVRVGSRLYLNPDDGTTGRELWALDVGSDGPPVLSFASVSSTVAESAGTHTVAVKVITPCGAPTTVPVSVSYATADGSAADGNDYEAVSGTLTFPADSASGSTLGIPVTILDDALDEEDETLFVQLSSPTGGTLGTLETHTVSIADDDPPAITINDASVTEGISGATRAIFSVLLSSPSDSPVTVSYETADRTAGSGSDYLPASGTISFSPGAQTRSIEVVVLGDRLVEPDETLVVNLSSPVNASIANSQGQATILNDDIAGQFQFSAPRYTVAEAGVTAMATVTRTGGLGDGVSVQVVTADGSAVAPADYAATGPTTLNFGAGVTMLSVQVPIVNDTLDEPNETVLLRLLNPNGFGAGLGVQQTAVVTILDNDVGGKFQLGAAGYTVSEGAASLIVTVKRLGGLGSGVSVQVDTANGTATAGSDYSPVTADILNFTASQTVQYVTIPIIPDASPEGNETFRVTLSNPAGGATLGVPTTATATIAEDEATVAFGAPTYAVGEAARSFAVTVRRTGPLTGSASVQYETTVGGSAIAGSDYTAVGPTTLTVPAGVSVKVFVIPLKPDTLVEGNETINLMLSNATGATLGAPSTAVLNITDDDLGGAFRLGSAAYSVSEGAASLIVPVKRSGGLGSGASVRVDTANGTATAGSDYSPVTANVLNFMAGQTVQYVTIPILPDASPEGNETFTVTLSNPQNVANPALPPTLGSPATASVTILDNEAILQFSAATFGVVEPRTGTRNAIVSVKRTGSLVGTVSVNYTTSDGTAKVGDLDYTAASGVLTFLKQSLLTFLVPILSDTANEGIETVNLALSGPSTNASVGPLLTAVLKITDDEPVVQFSAAANAMSEPKGATGTAFATITVRRLGNLTLGSTVPYATSNGTASVGSDYTTTSGTLSFLAGQSALAFKVAIMADTDDEPNETVNLTLSSPSGASLGTFPTGVLTIVDNDVAGKIQFQGALYSVNENSGQAVITLTRTGGAASNATVKFDTSDGTATGLDYDTTSTTVTFAAGQLTQTVTIPISSDGLGEGSETVNLTLSLPGGGATLGTQTTAVLYIVNNSL